MFKRGALLKKPLPGVYGDMKAFVVQAGPFVKRKNFVLQLEYPDECNKKGHARAVGGCYLSVSACMDISVACWLDIAVDSEATTVT